MFIFLIWVYSLFKLSLVFQFSIQYVSISLCYFLFLCLFISVQFVFDRINFAIFWIFILLFVCFSLSIVMLYISIN